MDNRVVQPARPSSGDDRYQVCCNLAVDVCLLTRAEQFRVCDVHLNARDVRHHFRAFRKNYYWHLRGSSHRPRAHQHLRRALAEVSEQHLRVVARDWDSRAHHRDPRCRADAPNRALRLPDVHRRYRH